MHCKACDALLNEFDLRKRNPANGEHLDLCGTCRQYSYEAYAEATYDNWARKNEREGLDTKKP